MNCYVSILCTVRILFLIDCYVNISCTVRILFKWIIALVFCELLGFPHS